MPRVDPPGSGPPVFWQYFDRPTGSFAGTWSEGASIAAGGGRIYVSSEGSDKVYIYNADTSYVGVISVQRPISVSYYRGELYVARNPGFAGLPSEVKVYDESGNFQRGFPVNTSLEGDHLNLHSVDVAWGEVWAILAVDHPWNTGPPVPELVPGDNLPPAQLRVFDAASGALKRIVPLAGNIRCEPPAPPIWTGPIAEPDWSDGQCPETTLAPSRGSWLDIAIAPELERGIVQRKLAVRRGPLGSAMPAQDVSALANPVYPEATEVLRDDCDLSGRWCDNYSVYEGSDAVWGMNRLLVVTGSKRFGDPREFPRGEWIQEFHTDAPLTPENLQPALKPVFADQPSYIRSPWLVTSLQRAWQPMQAQTNTVRDLVYQPHPTAIVWSGPLTTHDWLRSTQALPYVVSNADAYVVGARGERWLEPDHSVSTVELRIDGVLKATNSGPSGEFSVDTTGLSNGEHVVEVTAHLGSWAEVQASNTIRVDNAAPLGELIEPEDYLWGSVPILGTLADQHAGTLDWQLEVQRVGEASWREPCIQPRTAPDPETGYFRCDWNTANGAFPDGIYRIRGQLRDRASDGGNIGHSHTWEEIEVANDVPHEATNVLSEPPSPRQQHDNPPETFDEPPVDENAPPDESTSSEPTSYGEYPPSCPVGESMEMFFPDYVLPIDGEPSIGVPTPELALQVYLLLPEVPAVPVSQFVVKERGLNHVVFAALDGTQTKAVAEVNAMQGQGWLLTFLWGCSEYFRPYTVPDPLSLESGVPPVDGAIETVKPYVGLAR